MSRGELWICIVIAVLLVLLRSLVPLFWESTFNSDQAIVGLMAKHLSEFRAFPLFFYGQNYMLGVQSWIAVPFFWVGGPTVTMLRLPLVLVGAGVAVAFVVTLTRLGLRPLLALVASMPVIVTTPLVSDALAETMGASVEPFAYVLLLWALRHRPAWFGAVFCVTHLHREFVVFAAPSVALAMWWERRWWSAAQTVRAAAAFAVVWIVVDLLKRTVNATGPAGGEHTAGSLVLQPQQIVMWLSLDAAPYLGRLRHAVLDALPDMLGARPHSMSTYSLIGGLDAGWIVAGVTFAAAAALSVARVLRHRPPLPRTDRRAAFVLYLTAIGLQTLLTYGLNSGIPPEHAPVVRYLLFVLLVPVALFAWFFMREPSAHWRTVVAMLLCVWAAFTAADNVRWVTAFVRSPPPHPHREIADYLVSQQIRFARAGYWDAYAITFLSREQVIVASTEKVRINAYQALVDHNASTAVTLWRYPCSTGPRVSAWCIQRP